MLAVYVLVGLVMVVLFFNIPVTTLIRYVKSGKIDKLFVKHWVFHPVIGFSWSSSVFDKMNPFDIVQRVFGFFHGKFKKALVIPKTSLRNAFIGFVLQTTPRCKVFQWYIDIGFDGAADTACAIGIAWSIMAFLLNSLCKYIVFSKSSTDIRITPRFDQVVLDTSVFCIFQTRLGHIMIAGFRALLSSMTQYFRGGDQHE